jgi:hypothetical protein
LARLPENTQNLTPPTPSPGVNWRRGEGRTEIASSSNLHNITRHVCFALFALLSRSTYTSSQSGLPFAVCSLLSAVCSLARPILPPIWSAVCSLLSAVCSRARPILPPIWSGPLPTPFCDLRSGYRNFLLFPLLFLASTFNFLDLQSEKRSTFEPMTAKICQRKVRIKKKPEFRLHQYGISPGIPHSHTVY